ncbi:MAG: hypothetical protein Q9N68_01170 [Gammaproteobacteria bacterium]|nr:hypothetical protein [Gammaproteobacteria bacterium]
MMNGHLLNFGYPVISVPVKKQLIFNALMLRFSETPQQDEMQLFLRGCLDQRVVTLMR